MKKEYTPCCGRHNPRKGFWIFIIVIAVILIAGTIRVENLKSAANKELQRMQNDYHALRRHAAAVEETKRRRVEYFQNCFLADFPARYSYGAADFMRRLSLTGTKNIILEKLEITPRGQDLAFNLIIGIDSGNTGAQPQAIFSRYYRELQRFDDLVEINFSRIDTRTGKRKIFKIAGTIEIE